MRNCLVPSNHDLITLSLYLTPNNLVHAFYPSFPYFSISLSFVPYHTSITPSYPFPSYIFLSRFRSPCLYNVALIVEATSLNLVLIAFNNSILCLHRRSKSFIALSHNGSCNIYISIKATIINISRVKDSPLTHQVYHCRRAAESTDLLFQY